MMFKFGKKDNGFDDLPCPVPWNRLQQEDVDKEVDKHLLKIISDFVNFIADTYQPGMIYDVSVLPYKKERIKRTCILWIQKNKGAEIAEGWVSLFPILSRFQEGIGPKPAGVSYLSIDLNDETIDKLLRENEGALGELSKKVDSEYIELYNLACEILQIKGSFT